ncbi:MAG: hypothetical protein U0183_10955 [Polyangiaceae bacterium]
MDFAAFIARYADSVGERANKDSYLKDLCTVLALPHPEPSTGDAARDAYVFEKDAKLSREGASATTKKIDLSRRRVRSDRLRWLRWSGRAIAGGLRVPRDPDLPWRCDRAVRPRRMQRSSRVR